MTLDEIYAVITKKFPSLRSRKRRPHGWSWFDGAPGKGNRIIKAVGSHGYSEAGVYRVPSSRLERNMNEAKLLRLVAEELRRYRGG